MELKLMVKGKEKVYKSQPITFRVFETATSMIKRIDSDEFLAESYPMSDLDEAVGVIIEYFKVDEDTFKDGFTMNYSGDFFNFFNKMLMNIQLNDGKRQVETDSEGK